MAARRPASRLRSTAPATIRSRPGVLRGGRSSPRREGQHRARASVKASVPPGIAFAHESVNGPTIPGHRSVGRVVQGGQHSPIRVARFAADRWTKLRMVAAVIALLVAIVGALSSAFRSRASPVAENLALRQQLVVLRIGRRPRLGPIDRAFWVIASRVASRGVDVLAIVQPPRPCRHHCLGHALRARIDRTWARCSSSRGRIARDSPDPTSKPSTHN